MSLPLATLDRLTIVYRKWVEARLIGEERAEKWEKEVGRLMGATSDEAVSMKQVLKLGAINAAIWQRQDRLRALSVETQSTATEGKVAQCAYALLKLNDWRAEVMGEEKFKGGVE